MWAERGFDSPTQYQFMLEWRNGRRKGLKIPYQQWCVGSSPTSSTNYGLVAQWLEQAAHNRLVGGSNPSGASILSRSFNG